MHPTERQLAWSATPGKPIDPDHNVLRAFTETVFTLIVFSTAKRGNTPLKELLTNRQHPAIVAWYEYDKLSEAMDMLGHFVILYPEHDILSHYSDMTNRHTL